MENSNNRKFYKLSTEQQKDYLKNKKKYIAFRIRIPDNLLNIVSCKLNEYEDLKDIKTCKKSNKTKRDKVEEYDFDVIPYNHDKAREMTTNHLVIATLPEYKDEVSNIFKNNFSGVSLHNSGYSVSVQLSHQPLPRGKWITDGDEETIKYPICILSYKRANKYGFTHKFLTECKIPHYLFIEPQDEEDYRNWYNPAYCKLIVADENLSQRKMGGSQMRNYILDYANWILKSSKVWMLDDNIKSYKRFHHGVKNEIYSNEIFTSIEKYVERYNNVGAVSHNFNPYITENDNRACIVKNNKCYSSLLLDTKGIRFDYKYEEDNILSMLYIGKGYCNLSFNHILYDKDTSGANGGGNQVSLYNGSGYKMKYEYFKSVLFTLIIEEKLQLVSGSTLDDLCSISTTMKSKDIHHKLDYSRLVGNDNNIIEKDNYDDIVASQHKSKLKFIPYERDDKGKVIRV